MPRPITANQLADFWRKNFTSKDVPHCRLCGNTGIVDTQGAKTSAGLEVGGRFYCVCPNGDALRRQSGRPGPDHYYDS